LLLQKKKETERKKKRKAMELNKKNWVSLNADESDIYN